MNKLLLTILFSISAVFVFGQYPIKQGSGNNPNTIVNSNAIKVGQGFVNSGYSDTAEANLYEIKNYPNAQIVVKGSIWIRNSTATAWLNASNSGLLRDGLISTGGITLVDSTVTIADTIKWSIGGVTHIKLTPSVFTISSADSNYYRRDLIYADTLGELYKIEGQEDTVIAVTPKLPPNTVLVTVVDVYGKQILPPTPEVVTPIPNLQRVTNEGNTTTNQIISNYNGGGYAFTHNSSRNGFTGMLSYNSSSGTGAGGGFLAVNDVNHIGQLYQGSSNNAYAPDGFLIRGSGTGGMRLTADIGRISFNKGLLYTANTPSEMGAFETNGDFGLRKVDSLDADINNIAFFDKDGIFKRGHITTNGKDSSAYHTVTQGDDSTFFTINDLKGRSDVIKFVFDTSTNYDNYYTKSEIDALFATAQTTLTLTTNGTSGPSTLVNNNLNVPNYVGGTPTVVQTQTSGSSVTVNDNTTWIIINPLALLPTLTITFPAAPANGQVLDISFGGTMSASGSIIITNLTIQPNASQGIVGETNIGQVTTEDKLSYRYSSINSKWYKN